LGFLLASFFFVFGTLFGRKKVTLLNPFRAAKLTGKLPIDRFQINFLRFGHHRRGQQAGFLQLTSRKQTN
jgi:hypothetical protein